MMLQKGLIVVVALIVLFVGAGYLLPGSYRVERSTVIDAPPEVVYAELVVLRTWSEWSCWTRERDPTCRWEFAGQGRGASMTWDGAELGQGMLTPTRLQPGERVEYDLSFENGRFLGQGGVRLEPSEGGTQVIMWSGCELGANPLLRWMGLMMDGMVGGEHELGLTGLKRRLESES
jgi:hypothetical protein